MLLLYRHREAQRSPQHRVKIMEAHEISFENLENLAVLVKKAKFAHFVAKQAQATNWRDPFDHVDFVFEKFLEAHAVGDFKSLFIVWDSGLEWMRGKNLVEGCLELTYVN
jgi:hypothetical protein